MLVPARGQLTIAMRGECSGLVDVAKIDTIRRSGLSALCDEERASDVCGDYAEGAVGIRDEPDEVACAAAKV